MLDDEGLEDPILGDDDFEDGSLVSFVFEDDFLGVEAPGGGTVFGDVVLGATAGGRVAFGSVAFGAGSSAGAAFDRLVFKGETVAFEEASLCPVFFGVATAAGFGSGARSIRDATGALVVGAVNCPLAIWRARSFTLTNILTERRVHVQHRDPGGAHAFYD